MTSLIEIVFEKNYIYIRIFYNRHLIKLQCNRQDEPFPTSCPWVRHDRTGRFQANSDKS